MHLVFEFGEYSQVLTKQGLKFLKNKQYDDALKLFQKAIDLDSENSEAAESLKAVESFLAKKKSQTKDTQYSDILTNRGVQLMEEEKYEDAISLFERAIQNNPQNTIAIRKRKEAIREHQKQKENGENENTAWLFASEDSSPPSPTIEKTENPLVDGSETTTERVEESLPPKTTEEGDSSENLEKINEILVSEGKRETEEYDKCDGKIREGTIGVDFYEGVTLDQKLPVQFQLGEYIQISGKVEGGTKNVTAFMSDASGTSEQQFAFDGKIQEDRFTVDVFFPQTGEYLLSVMPKNEGTSKAKEISVVSLTCAPKSTNPSSAPQSLRANVENGDPVFSWQDNENDVFHVRFSQGDNLADFYVRGIQRFSPPLYEFEDFSEGDVVVSIWGAKLSASNIFERETEWSKSSTMKITAVQHISRSGNSITDITLNDTYTLGETIEISGTTDLPLDETLLIIDPKMQVQEEELTTNGNRFSGTFTPKISGNHIFEVNQNDMLSLFVGASVHQGTIPILPDYFDMEDRQKETLSLDAMDEVMLAMINTERQKMGLNTLDSNRSLQQLAQFRAQDMCDRGYMAHIDPDGKNAGDHAENFGIEGSIGENIGTGESVRSIHEGLMQSASHMRLILGEKNKEAGFGFCWKNDDQLMGVEIFGQ
jgi:hypothetical protein